MNTNYKIRAFSGRKYALSCRMMCCQIRYDHEFFKFQASCYDLTAKFCKVIFVRMSNALFAKTFQYPGDLGAGFPQELGAQVFVLETADRGVFCQGR